MMNEDGKLSIDTTARTTTALAWWVSILAIVASAVVMPVLPLATALIISFGVFRGRVMVQRVLITVGVLVTVVMMLAVWGLNGGNGTGWATGGLASASPQ